MCFYRGRIANKFQLKLILLKTWMSVVIKASMKIKSTKYLRVQMLGIFPDN